MSEETQISQSLRTALSQSKISKELSRAFAEYLSEFPQWEAQARYLLEDKEESIEYILEEMYDVPIKEQPDWKKKESGEENAAQDAEGFDSLDEIYGTSDEKYKLFKNWKQDHGLDSMSPEVGDIHTFIRFELKITADREEKYLWRFNQVRFGKRGWGHERITKNLANTILDNNNNPGWVVKDFLEKNILLRDEHDQRPANGEIPNPLLLSSRDTHSLLFLLLGHPYLYYGDRDTRISNSHQEVDFEVRVYRLDSHRVLYGNFYYTENKKRREFIVDHFSENGIILHGLPKSIIYDDKYYRIRETIIPAKMISESFSGILIPDDDWKEFLASWKSFYPNRQLMTQALKVEDMPSLLARNLKDWRYWLNQPEHQVQLFAKDEYAIRICLGVAQSLDNEEPALSVKSTNLDNPNSRLLLQEQRPKAGKLLHLLRELAKLRKPQHDFNVITRHTASQLMILAEEYPFIFNEENEPIFSPSVHEFFLTISKNPVNAKQYILEGKIMRMNSRKKLINAFRKGEVVPKALGYVPSFMLHKNKLLRISSMVCGKMVNDTLQGIIIEEREVSDFYATSLTYLRERGIQIDDPHGLLRISAIYNYSLEGQMTVWEVAGILMGRLKVIMKTGVGDFEYPWDAAGSDVFYQRLDKQKLRIPRNRFLEQSLREHIYEDGWVQEGDNEFSMNDKSALNFVLEVLPQSKEQPHPIRYYGMQKLKRWQTKKIQPSMSTSVSTGINWFDVDLKIEHQGSDLVIQQIVDIWKKEKKAIELPQSEGIAVIDEEWISKYAPILNRILESSKKLQSVDAAEVIAENLEKEAQKEEQLKVEKFQLGLLNEIEQAAVEVSRDQGWRDLSKSFNNFKGIKKQRIPKEIKANLRDYQKDGVNWLCFLRTYGFGGILADDMGLGKTLQTLSFLYIAKKKKWHKHPNLVIAPTSVVTNWKAEVEKFLPDFNCLLLHGSNRKALFEKAEECDLLITTYGLLQRDLPALTSLQYSTLILDEAQMIKNVRSKTAMAVSTIKAEHRITLTGTPIENSITEFWSQFNFLMPGFMGTYAEFQRDYIRPTTKKSVKKRPDYGLLRRQTKPFILRRMKQQVAKELPPKTEQTLYCEMNDRQRELYESVLHVIRQQIGTKIKNSSLQETKVAIFDALLKLRQICCEPRLSTLVNDNPPPSAKIALFAETISAIVGEGHRVLVFSQFVKMLNLMHETLHKAEIPFLQLDGSTQNRDEVVAKFQEEDTYSVFLISLKAGGTGINLTAADYVIHYDPWWNPAAENQATDRAYRIGQKNHLHVYKLITRNSIEEKILDLQRKKSAIAQKIIEVSGSIESMFNLDDIQEIFSL